MANFRAVELRVKRQSTEFDHEVASAQYFERNPFLWQSFGDRDSHIRLTTLWLWSRGEKYGRFEHVLLHNLQARGSPVPKELKQSDENLWQRLIAISNLETKASKSPCIYLGAKKKDGTYETYGTSI